MSMKHAVLAGALFLAIASLSSAIPKPSVKTPFVFTDEAAIVRAGIDAGEVACHVVRIK